MPTITKTGAGQGSNGYRIEAKLEVSYSKKSNTSYTVSAALYTRVGSDYSSSSVSNNNCTSWVNINGAVARRYNFTIDYSSINHSWEYLGTNTQEVNTNGKEKTITIIGQWEMPSSNWVTGGYISGNVTLPALTSACTAPTTITISNNQTIQKPGGKITLNWNGATSGTNNTINGYDVYWRIDKNPTVTTYSGLHSVSKNSYTFTIPSNAKRGSKYYFKVVTKGEAGSEFYSPISSVSKNIKVNQLPSAPSVSLDKTQVDYDEDPVTVSTILANDPDGESLTYAYSINNGAKIDCSEGTNITNVQGKEIYFFAKDIEYGPATIKQIENTPLTLNITKLKLTESFNSSLLENDLNNKYAKKIEVSATVNKNKTNCKLSLYKIRQSYTLNPFVLSGDWSQKIYIKTITCDGINKNYNFEYDTNTDFSSSDESTAFKLGIEYSDGVDTVDFLQEDGEWGSSDDIQKGYFIVAPYPKILEVWNNYNADNNILNSIQNTFYKSGRLKVSIDDAYGFNQSYLITQNSSNSINLTYSETSTKSIKWIVGDNDLALITPNTLYQINATYLRNGISFTSSFNITSCGLPRLLDNTEIKESNISSIKNLSNNTIKPYSMKDNKTNSLISITPYLEDYNYLLPSIENNVYNGIINFILEYNGKRTSPLIISDLEKTDSSYDFNIPYKNFYNFVNNNSTTNPLNLNLNSRNTVNLIIQFKDVFNHIHEIKKENYLTLDFREPLGGILTISKSVDDTLLSDDIIYENSSITYNFTYTSEDYYNSGKAKIETFICRTQQKEKELENLNWVPYPTAIGNSATFDITKDKQTEQKFKYTVPEIQTSNYLYFKIHTTLNGEEQDIYYNKDDSTEMFKKPFISQKFIAPSFNGGNTNFSYNSSNNNLICGGSLSDAGAGRVDNNKDFIGIGSFDIGVQYYTTGKEDSALYFNGVAGQNDFFALFSYNITEETETPISFSNATTFNFEEQTYYNFRLVIRTYLGDNKTIYKEAISNSCFVYNELPTVAYRKNKIGINAQPDALAYKDSIIVISDTKDKNKITILSSLREQPIIIDLLTGTISGVVINGGEVVTPASTDENLT